MGVEEKKKDREKEALRNIPPLLLFYSSCLQVFEPEMVTYCLLLLKAVVTEHRCRRQNVLICQSAEPAENKSGREGGGLKNYLIRRGEWQIFTRKNGGQP